MHLQKAWRTKYQQGLLRASAMFVVFTYIVGYAVAVLSVLAIFSNPLWYLNDPWLAAFVSLAFLSAWINLTSLRAFVELASFSRDQILRSILPRDAADEVLHMSAVRRIQELKEQATRKAAGSDSETGGYSTAPPQSRPGGVRGRSKQKRGAHSELTSGTEALSSAGNRARAKREMLKAPARHSPMYLKELSSISVVTVHCPAVSGTPFKFYSCESLPFFVPPPLRTLWRIPRACFCPRTVCLYLRVHQGTKAPRRRVLQLVKRIEQDEDMMQHMGAVHAIHAILDGAAERFSAMKLEQTSAVLPCMLVLNIGGDDPNHATNALVSGHQRMPVVNIGRDGPNRAAKSMYPRMLVGVNCVTSALDKSRLCFVASTSSVTLLLIDSICCLNQVPVPSRPPLSTCTGLPTPGGTGDGALLYPGGKALLCRSLPKFYRRDSPRRSTRQGCTHS